MTGDYQFTMSLVFRHPDIDPARITRALALQPEHKWRQGEARRDDHGDVLTGAHRDSYWICDFASSAGVEGEQAELESELSRLIQTLRKSMSFMQHLQDGGGTAELLISLYAHKDFRIELSAADASLLGRLGVALSIEVRPPLASTASSVVN